MAKTNKIENKQPKKAAKTQNNITDVLRWFTPRLREAKPGSPPNDQPCCADYVIIRKLKK